MSRLRSRAPASSPRPSFAVWVAMGLLTTGCIEELDPASLVDSVRVLGARVEVAGEPARAWPRPGETAHVSFIVAGNEDSRPVDWFFISCPALPVRTGLPLCQPGSSHLRIYSGSGVPELSVAIPAVELLAGEPDFVLLGVVCGGGSVRDDISVEGLEAGEPLCAGEGVDETKLTLELPIQYGEESNLNPELSPSFVRFRGTEWAPPPDPVASLGCASLEPTPALPRVSRAEAEAIDLLVRPEGTVRESFVAPFGDPPVPRTMREVLVVSSFATAGELERQFTVIDDDTAEAILAYDLPAPDGIPTDGLLVRFYFVARDERGGVDSATRVACVVP